MHTFDAIAENKNERIYAASELCRFLGERAVLSQGLARGCYGTTGASRSVREAGVGGVRQGTAT